MLHTSNVMTVTMASLLKMWIDFLIVEGQSFHMHGIVALIASLRPTVMHTGGYPENMMVGGTHGEINPNSSWLNSKGMWLAYMLGVLLLHLILLSFPFLSVAVVWTLTNLTHNLAMFVFLHTVKGTPWEPNDQGLSRRLTHWEQIDCGEQFTATRKFLTVVPIALFFLTSFYTKYDSLHFGINLIALTLVLVPKLPQFHLVRLFGINKY